MSVFFGSLLNCFFKAATLFASFVGPMSIEFGITISGPIQKMIGCFALGFLITVARSAGFMSCCGVQGSAALHDVDKNAKPTTTAETKSDGGVFIEYGITVNRKQKTLTYFGNIDEGEVGIL